MAAAQQATQFVVDEHVAGLADSFAAFLADFSPEGWMPEPSQATQGSQDAGAAPRSFMARRVEEMCQSGETVLYVEYDHLQAFSYEMSHQIRDYFERAEPVMRRALQDHVRAHQPDYLKEAHGVEKEFFVGVTGLPDAERLRDLRVEKIGRLVSFSGTVTRTTEVRPELFLGAFKCAKCSTRVTGVEQQYKYTTPTLCKKQSCGNRCAGRGRGAAEGAQGGGRRPRAVALRLRRCDPARASPPAPSCGTAPRRQRPSLVGQPVRPARIAAPLRPPSPTLGLLTPPPSHLLCRSPLHPLSLPPPSCAATPSTPAGPSGSWTATRACLWTGSASRCRRTSTRCGGGGGGGVRARARAEPRMEQSCRAAPRAHGASLHRARLVPGAGRRARAGTPS